MGRFNSKGMWVESDPMTMFARGAVFADVADLSAFTVASNDGLTYAEGQTVLLANQTTAAQCGLYLVGKVTGTTAPLTRHPDWDSGPVRNGALVQIAEGTIWAGSEWKAMVTGAKVIGTDDPLFYPKHVKGTITLVAGTITLGSTQGLFLFSTTKSAVNVTRNTPNTSTSTTGGYQCAAAGRTIGKSGTAAAIIIATVAAGTINTADISTLDFCITNY
jgi:hypothetical protein